MVLAISVSCLAVFLAFLIGLLIGGNKPEEAQNLGSQSSLERPSLDFKN